MFRLEILFCIPGMRSWIMYVLEGEGIVPKGFSVRILDIYILNNKCMDNVLFRLDRSVRMCRNS